MSESAEQPDNEEEHTIEREFLLSWDGVERFYAHLQEACIGGCPMDFSDPAHSAVVSTLISTLRHGPADARHHAFTQLADLGPVVLVPLLDLITKADRQHLGWILDGIEWEDGEGQTGDPPFDLLTATRDEPFWYLAAVTRLIERLGREASPALIMLLADAESITRSWAACLLGHTGDPAAVPSLLARLASPDHCERTWVIDALGRIGDRRAVPQLIPFVVDDAADLQSVAALALGRIGDPRAVAPLITLLRQANVSVYAASSALSQLGAAAIPDLIAVIHDPDVPKATHDLALMTLGHSDDPRVPPVILQYFDRHDDPKRRSRVVGYAGRLRIAAAVPHIRDLFLSPPDMSVQYNTATALAQIGTPAALQILYDALVSDRFELAHSAALAFSYAPHADRAPLRMLADNDDSRLQCAAIVALGNLRDQESSAMLHRAMQHADPLVRSYAQNALEKITNARDENLIA